MPGAIVPNDWDGSTYTQRRVIWPDSPLWIEQLSGGLSAVSLFDHWDPDTGDPEQASDIGQDLIELNIVDGFYPGKEADMLTPMWFSAVRPGGSDQINVAAWTAVAFTIDAANKQAGNHGWQGDYHVVRAEQYGLWQYSFKLGGLSAVDPIFYLGFADDWPDPFGSIQRAARYTSVDHANYTLLHLHRIDVDFVPAAYHQAGATYSDEPRLTSFEAIRLAALPG